jgi:hypothetical protein
MHHQPTVLAMNDTFELKTLSKKGVATALAKVERYRLLNEPWEAESICLDVLAVEPDNQQAVVSLLLALTDQFGMVSGDVLARARELLPKLDSAYAQAYYAGIICERRGKSLLETGGPGTGPAIYEWLRQAMAKYEEAGALRPEGNEDAIIRWNTCARIIMRHDQVRAAGPDRSPPPMLE